MPLVLHHWRNAFHAVTFGRAPGEPGVHGCLLNGVHRLGLGVEEVYQRTHLGHFP